MTPPYMSTADTKDSNMTIGTTLFILGVMPFTVIGMIVVCTKIGNWFNKEKKK